MNKKKLILIAGIIILIIMVTLMFNNKLNVEYNEKNDMTNIQNKESNESFKGDEFIYIEDGQAPEDNGEQAPKI